ncbi:MAG: aminotransferase class IV [Rhizobiales bacterium]|nr:aminotransferase class IV [Hyphomicrobiales bacterium]
MRDNDLIWWNGELVSWRAAQVHVTSETALRGLNIFEGIRAYWRQSHDCYAVVALDAHLDRLEQSARLLHIPVSGMRAHLKRGLQELLDALPETVDLYLRPTIYVESGGYETNPSAIKVGAFISWRLAEARVHRSLHCLVSKWRHIPPNSLPSAAKIGAAYTAFRLARLEATSKGFDEAILLNERGEITETPGGSIFALKGRHFATPPIDAGILPSITRRIVRELLCPELGLHCEERSLVPEDLRGADAAMVVGTLDEISHIVTIDDHKFRNDHPAFAVIDELSHLYRSLWRGEIDKRAESWVHLVPRKGAPR